MDTTCPYCNKKLSKAPKRKTKCVNCGQYVYVNSDRTFYSKPLLTEEEDLVTSTFMQLTSTYGWNVTPSTYKRVKKELTEQFGTTAEWGDVTWTIYQELAGKFAKIGDFNNLAMVYGSMAHFLWSSHKEFKGTLKEAARYRLMLFKQYGSTEGRFYSYAYSCDACSKLENQNFNIDDALVNIPLPPDGCTCVLDKNLESGYCICELASNN